MSELATLDFDGPIATLRLNRPDSRNALSIELIGALRDRVGEVRERSEITVLVLNGEGRSFCAGMDLKQVQGGGDIPATLLRALAELTLEIRSLAAVVLASVNGAAIGGGCGLACVCDLALTHDDAKLGFPEVDLGLCPAVVAPWVVRRMGGGRARSLLLRGGLISGRDAEAIGLVDESADSRESLVSLTEATAKRLSEGGPQALRVTKALLNEIDGSDDATLVRRGAELSASVIAGDEAQAALRARFGER